MRSGNGFPGAPWRISLLFLEFYLRNDFCFRETQTTSEADLWKNDLKKTGLKL